MCNIVRACFDYHAQQAAQQRQKRQTAPSDPEKACPTQAYEAEAIGERCGGSNGGGDGSGDGGPPLPPDHVYAQGRHVDFTALAGRNNAGVAWPFSAAQWNRMQHFMRTIRIPRGGDEGLVPYASVLELYVAYVLMNGMHRFESGIPEEDRGEWLTSHLEAFTHGLQSVQGMALYDRLIYRQGEAYEMMKWQQTLGLPASPCLQTKIVLPHWQQVRRMMFQMSLRTPQRSDSDSMYAQMWRRISFGHPGSQLRPGGTLPATALIWACPPRVRDKASPPTWLSEIYQTKAYRSYLVGDRHSYVQVGGRTLLSRLQEAGVATRAQLGRLIQA